MHFTRRFKSLAPAIAAFSLLASGVAEAKIKTVVVTSEVENTADDKAATTSLWPTRS